MQRTKSGYSLVEVLVAMGIFGAVVMSVLTLFYMGSGNVYAGKKMTEAVAVTTKVQEDLSGMTWIQMYNALMISDATSLGTINTDEGGLAGSGSYTNSIRRSTDTISASTEFGYPGTSPACPAAGTGGLLTRWKSMICPDRFNNALVELAITPTAPRLPANKITTANIVKIRLIMSWNEQTKRRRIIFDMVKAQPL